MNLLLFLLIGLAAGWIAGQIMKSGFGLVGNLIVGVVGAFIGGWLLPMVIDLGGSLLASLITAVVGAVILLWVIGLVKRPERIIQLKQSAHWFNTKL